MDSGYWVKFEVKTTKTTPNIPHGIKYSLTLHDKNNKRILGYDNAHSYKPKNKKFACNKETWDHLHKKMEIFPYEFETADQLIVDFWNSVNKQLEQL
jgi:predicted AlkP superfamily pyrophosphatase or phosphodiesterase